MTSSEETLAAAGVAIVASVPSAPGGLMTGPLASELVPFWGDSVTSRLPLVRSSAARAEWLATQLATLGPPGRYFALIGVGIVPVLVAAPWLCIEAGPDPGWLPRLWTNCWKSLLLLSDAGDRVLQLTEVTGVPDTLAQAHATADVLALRADRARLDAMLDAVPGLRSVPGPPGRIAVRSADLYAAPVVMSLPAFASDPRRETWFVDAFERFRALRPALDDRSGDRFGPYSVSLARAPYVAALCVYAETPADLAALWARAGHDRLVMLDDERRRALVLSCAGEMFEARIVALG